MLVTMHSCTERRTRESWDFCGRGKCEDIHDLDYLALDAGGLEGVGISGPEGLQGPTKLGSSQWPFSGQSPPPQAERRMERRRRGRRWQKIFLIMMLFLSLLRRPFHPFPNHDIPIFPFRMFEFPEGEEDLGRCWNLSLVEERKIFVTIMFKDSAGGLCMKDLERSSAKEVCREEGFCRSIQKPGGEDLIERFLRNLGCFPEAIIAAHAGTFSASGSSGSSGFWPSPAFLARS